MIVVPEGGFGLALIVVRQNILVEVILELSRGNEVERKPIAFGSRETAVQMNGRFRTAKADVIDRQLIVEADEHGLVHPNHEGGARGHAVISPNPVQGQVGVETMQRLLDSNRIKN